MAIPDFQTIMLPLMKIAEDGQEHTNREYIDKLGYHFSLTDTERKELLPSGRQARFDNRVGWAITYLRKAGLLESTGRGKSKITERGLKVLKANPQAINMKFLEQFPEYIEFRDASSNNKDRTEEQPEDDTGDTPEEVLEQSYQELREELARELLNEIKNQSPAFFERLVVDLLVAMGYGGSRRDAGKAVGQTDDGGIDGIIKEDKLGLDAVYIQAKRWESTVGRPVVQGFAGSLAGQKARKGVLITTSQFSQKAIDYVDRIDMSIVLIDGERLAQLMIDHNLGVSEVATYTIKRVDSDYFVDE